MIEYAEPIALLCAMESEISHVRARVEECSSFALGPWSGFRGMLAGRSVVALATGIGMVNAAAATAALIAELHPFAVFNFGCAGAHHDEIYPGDVVIGSEVVAYGSLITLPDGTERYAGFRYDVGSQTVLTDSIRADRSLLNLASGIAETWQPEPWPYAGLRARDARIQTGVIASADCWTQDPHRISVLHVRHRSLCEDMEAAAVAQVCAIYQVPMLAIKDISNNELHAATGHGADGPTLAAVRHELGARSFALVEQIVAKMDGL